MKNSTSAKKRSSRSLSRVWATIPAVALAAMAGAAQPVLAQGCVSARHLPSAVGFDFLPLADLEPVSLESRPVGADDPSGEIVGSPTEAGTARPRTAGDLDVFDRGDIEFTLSFRALKAEDVFVGSTEIHAAKAADVNPIGEFRALDIILTYGLSRKWSLSLNMPLVSNDGNFRLGDGQRHALGTGIQLGDLRVTASRWLFDVGDRRSGNVVFGIGAKLPTGDDEVTDQFFTANGQTVRPLDGALQPGDGGWGVTLQAQGFQLVARRAYVFGDLFYLINPRESTGVVTPASGAQSLTLSVPDQYMARGGLGYLVAPGKGISVSLGLRLDGIPVQDLVGGSGGFRRPGYNLALEPTASFNLGPNLFSISVPLALERSRQQSRPEAELGIHPGGSMADEQFILSYSRRY